ncbi:unnamed protein product [Arctia plantaginis]|uniref:Uncharacterized protein n=1 Tax=Arctia plantaginis TaxID=874455 RepID=A0A8S1A9G1_ARCPL|nr:unnamed protein product [Arctia plantaginis]
MVFFMVTMVFLIVTVVYLMVATVLLMLAMVLVMVSKVVLMIAMVFFVVPMVFMFVFLVMDWNTLVFMGLMKNYTLRRISMTVIVTMLVMVLCNDCCNCDNYEEDLFENRKKNIARVGK